MLQLLVLSPIPFTGTLPLGPADDHRRRPTQKVGDHGQNINRIRICGREMVSKYK